MPTNTYPITTGESSLTERILQLEVIFIPVGTFTDIDRLVNITIVNGTMVQNTTPFNYVTGGGCYIEIVDMIADPVVIFWDPTGLWIEGFSVVNPVLYTYTRTATGVPLLKKYAPLHNFLDPGKDINDDRNYNSPFTTLKLNLTEKSIVDLKLQPSYDGSVNMIFTDDSNPMRIVNSRFAVDESGMFVDLIDRRAKKDANTYNEVNFHQTELIPRTIGIPTLTFDGVIPGGILPGGGYRYFFKYVNADGAETDIIEESRLVSVHEGDTTLNAMGVIGAPTTKSVSFSLSDLDQSFYGIVVYYTVSTGEVDSVDTAHKILSTFIIENDGTCKIVHTGYEQVSLVNIETLSLTFSIISQSKTLDVVNNRLLVGNTEAKDVYDEELAVAAASLKIEESSFDILQHSKVDYATKLTKEENYSNPDFIYDKLGYWKGETYELGAVFISDTGLSPVYPLQGLDFSGGAAVYDPTFVGGIYKGFVKDGQNSLGIYRTENRSDLWTYAADKLTFSGTNLQVDITNLLSQVADPSKITGFFFVRRPRKKDALLQGLLTTVAAVPIETKFGSEYEISEFGNYCGVGVTSDVCKGNVKFVPAPMGIMPFGVEEVDTQIVSTIPFLDQNGANVETTSVFTSATVTLSSVAGLEVGDTLKFLGYCSRTVAVINAGAGTVTLSSAPAPVPPSGTTVQIGNVGTGVSTDFYIKAPIKDYSQLKAWSFYSPDLACAPSYFASLLNGSKVGLWCGRQAFTSEQINVTSTHTAPIGLNSVLYHRIISAIGAPSNLTGDVSAIACYVDTGAIGMAPKGFSGSTDRNLYCYWGYAVGSTSLTKANILTKIAAATTTFSSGNPIGKPLAYRPGNALAYGSYVGLKLNGYDGVSLDNLSADAGIDVGKNTNAYISLLNVGSLGSPYTDPQLGYLSSLYSSTDGTIIDIESWKSRYLGDEDTEYIAITKRFRTADYFTGNALTVGINPIIPIFGGDCFLGMAWKQVYYPLGIAEAPQTNDVTAYKTTRRSLGLLPYGYAIPVPGQANFNFNIRSKERVDTREFAVYGTDRSFLPLKGRDTIRGNRQFETGLYNHGYDATSRSADKQFRLNLNAPFYRFRYPNRVYASSVAAENNFVNGFTDFKGLNFKDYNSDLGALTKLIALNNVLIAVFQSGISQIGVDERSQVSSDTGGVYVDAAQVLSRANVINSNYGSDHLTAVCASNNFVYGVDLARKKVWRTNGQATTALEIISDLRIQNKLGSISSELIDILLGDISNRWLNVYSHFDSKKNELYFSFVVRDPGNSEEGNKTRTLVFNETLNLWICETDDVRKFVFQSAEDRYAFASVVGKYHSIYKYQIQSQADVDPDKDVFGEYNKFYENIYDMYYDYHVVDEQALYKIINNITIVGNNSLPTKITYRSDHNPETIQTLKPYTNIRYAMYGVTSTPVTVSGTTGTQILTLSEPVANVYGTETPLSYGHFVSIIDPDDNHTVYRYVVISYDGNVTLTIDKLLTREIVSQPLWYGYYYPHRLSDSTFEESYGVISCEFNKIPYGISPAKLRGKWMRFRHTYEGTAPVYISGIITDYGISLS